MPHAATKLDPHLPHRLLLATVLSILALTTLLPALTHAQTPSRPSDTQLEETLPASPNTLPTTGSGGLSPNIRPIDHPAGLSLTAALVGAGLVAALSAITVLTYHRTRREPTSFDPAPFEPGRTQ
ncbi:MAG TPA: hypothetical protein QGF05_13310 [Dehalococcoidia bacterium]|nr:hypothetical protein [Dehalococcoidia bacterium]